MKLPFNDAIAETLRTLEQVTGWMQYDGEEAVTSLEAFQIQRCYDYLSDATITLRAVQQTGTEIVQTIRFALAALNTVPGFVVPAQRLTDNLDIRSYAIAAMCDRVLERITGESPYSTRTD
ncbi:MAG TPA: hypothetical protein VHB79_24130 [Polyangiaceae bacterium]|nr:hypothetical protein [Polyangiaceae bacterium]